MKKLLLQLDTDILPSAFDRVVAHDSGVDNVIPYGSCTRDNITQHVHGMIFTRSKKNLHNSAIFIGGSDVSASELVGEAVKNSFFGDHRVSVMSDPNGSNTTAAAIVRKVVSHYDVNDKKVLIIGSGPVGQRTALLLKHEEGAQTVTLTSRDLARSKAIVDKIQAAHGVDIIPAQARSDESVSELLQNAHVAITCGPAGVCLITEKMWKSAPHLAVVADVNAVPPYGVEGISVIDDGRVQENIRFYGPIAIGNFKMKLHRAAIASLYERNDRFLDESTIYQIARQIEA